ncbi:GNAT family N-acetyltransferase [Legionella micdadei]|uniref:Acetyltransferase (GNAT) family protein n=1 Tax=Legionella micdadei TaxID=451 RepID=A0A098GBA3_LEGMI|nr:GNAT family N-acetyltransferase [Legionella micdadei]ARG96532.1 GNAT family N-acetyltransferase [Legionella micdadei]ARG99281.1 GNAT family N-acetyltransferase [Legionella micdadei]KTD27858.1 hypothetical protein Lmic_1852 [Legionella micdadei]NSL19540.1 GNAT family N-acetyltransferase [Legionella micdadei]CEG59764.1 protein of unknown function [Legionella micdadei]
MVQVRQIVRGDLPRLIPVMKRDWYASFVDFRHEDKSLTKDILLLNDIEQDFNNPQLSFYGLFNENNELIGFAKIKLLAQSAFLSRLFVNEDEAGNGYDRLLLQTCIEAALGAGILSMKVEVEDLNNEAISFYQRFGFTRQPNKVLIPSAGIYLHYNVCMVSMDLRHSLNLIEEDGLDEVLPLSFASSAA